VTVHEESKGVRKKKRQREKAVSGTFSTRGGALRFGLGRKLGGVEVGGPVAPGCGSEVERQLVPVIRIGVRRSRNFRAETKQKQKVGQANTIETKSPGS